MVSENTVRGFQNGYSANTFDNVLDFNITQFLSENMNTAEVVEVVGVDAGGASAVAGYVDVVPLVNNIDAYGNTVSTTTLFRLPYVRIQGGECALVIDPQPGDKGIAVYAQRDISAVRGGEEQELKRVQAGSFRQFSRADGLYIGGVLNKAPTNFVELTKDGKINIKATNDVSIDAGGKVDVKAASDITITTSANVNISCTNLTFSCASWSINTTGGGSGGTISGNISQTGSFTSTGDHSAGGISLTSHVHGDVQTGGGTTGGPQ